MRNEECPPARARLRARRAVGPPFNPESQSRRGATEQGRKGERGTTRPPTGRLRSGFHLSFRGVRRRGICGVDLGRASSLAPAQIPRRRLEGASLGMTDCGASYSKTQDLPSSLNQSSGTGTGAGTGTRASGRIERRVSRNKYLCHRLGDGDGQGQKKPPIRDRGRCVLVGESLRPTSPPTR